MKQATQVMSTERPCKDGLRHARGGRNKQTQIVGHQWQYASKTRLQSPGECHGEFQMSRAKRQAEPEQQENAC